MTKTGIEQENRNERTYEFKNLITKIRDWLGFSLTVAGFCMGLSGTIHIDIQVQCNIVVENYNYISKVDEVQWNGKYSLNLKDNTGRQKYHREWMYINLMERSYDIPKRKRQRFHQRFLPGLGVSDYNILKWQ